VARFCRERGIRKLSLFGSVLTLISTRAAGRGRAGGIRTGRPETRRLPILWLWRGTLAIIGRKVDFCSRCTR